MEDLIERTGYCRYCKAGRWVKAPKDATEEEVNEIASEECDCSGAQFERERKMKIEAASTWAEGIFTKQEQLRTMLQAIRAVAVGQVDSVSVKMGKRTYRVDVNSEGMIRIQTEYREKDEDTF